MKTVFSSLIITALLAVAALGAGTGINVNQTQCPIIPGVYQVPVAFAPPGTTGQRVGLTCFAIDKATLTVDMTTNPPTLKAIIPTAPVQPSVVFADDETPVGALDGTNAAFTLAQPVVGASLKVYRNGVRQRVGMDYALTVAGTTTTITFLAGAVPTAGDVLLADYRVLSQ